MVKKTKCNVIITERRAEVCTFFRIPRSHHLLVFAHYIHRDLKGRFLVMEAYTKCQCVNAFVLNLIRLHIHVRKMSCL